MKKSTKQIAISKKIKKLHKQDSSVSEAELQPSTRLRRGFKKCKNPECSHLLHIHTKICVKCGHSNQFLSSCKTKIGKKNKDNVLEFARKLSEFQPSVKVPKKYLDTIYVFKKNLLQRDQSNLDTNLLEPLLYDMSTRLHADQSKSKQNMKEYHMPHQSKRYKNGKMIKQKLQKMQTKMTVVVQSDDGSFKKYDAPTQIFSFPTESWKCGVLNFGCPIMSLQFAPRVTLKDPHMVEEQDFSQYLAVSLQINHYDYSEQKDHLFAKKQYQTIADFDLHQLHVSGVTYAGLGLVAIVKITYDHELKQFLAPKLSNTPNDDMLVHYLVTQEGCILKMKWCPKFSASECEIGLLGVVTALGVIQIISVPNLKVTLFMKTTIIQVIRMSNVVLTTFDWIVSRENDVIAVGDQNGSVYLLKLGLELHPQGFIVLNYLPSLHIAEITDLQFYLHNDSVCPLLATASYDGNVKVLEPFQSSDPILDLNLSSVCDKGIVKIQWDHGGKYLLVIRDDPTNRVLLLSFFAVEKGPKGQEAGYDLSNIVEQRFLGNLSGADIVMNSSSSFNQDQTFFSNYQGKVFACATETIRKLAVKKEKKQTQHADLFSHIVVDKNDSRCVVTIYDTLIPQKDATKKKKLDSPMGFNYFNEIHVCPNDIKEIDARVASFVAQGCLQGVLIINTVINKEL